MLNITENDMWNIICKDFKSKLENNKGLEHFAINKSKFEGWVRVELSDSLYSLANKITPEKDNIDLVINDCIAIELKTTNTNYKTNLVVNKSKNIKENRNEIIKDINCLSNNTNYIIKLVVFIVFPLEDRSKNKWEYHMNLIYSESAKFDLKTENFKFNNGVSGRIYMARIL